MRTRLLALASALVSLLLAAPADASKCRTPAERAALLETTAAVQLACDCAGASSANAYDRCARKAILARRDAGLLPDRCVAEAIRCGRASTCGRPAGAVTCCKTFRSGDVRCRVVASAAACEPPREGSAVLGQCPSCCQSCGAGSCQPVVQCCLSTSPSGALVASGLAAACVETTADACAAQGGVNAGPGPCQPDSCVSEPSTTTSSSSTTSTTTSTSSTTSTTTATSSTTTSSSVPPPSTTTTSTSTTSTTTEPCGNGVLDPGEDCDPPGSETCPNGSPGGGFVACETGCVCPEPSTTTTTTTTPSSTSTTVPGPAGTLDLRVASSSATCGRVTSDTGGATPIGSLQCGGLNIGGGNAVAPPEGPVPDGSINRFTVTACTGTTCTVGPSTTPPATAPGAVKVDCTDTGCRFGVPLPIVGAPATCVLNSFAAPAAGTFDLATGTTADLAVSLRANIFVTGLAYPVVVNGTDDARPCPTCVNDATGLVPVAGSPEAPAQGVCNGGARAGLACTSQNSQGLSADCEPGGTAGGTTCLPADDPSTPEAENACQDAFGIGVTNLGVIAVDLTPLSTGSAAATASDGRFCATASPPQTTAGCFNAELVEQGGRGTECRGIFADGAPYGDLRDAASHPGTLASVFCIPATGNALVDLSADLTGPGEVTLPGTLTFTPAAMAGPTGGLASALLPASGQPGPQCVAP